MAGRIEVSWVEAEVPVVALNAMRPISDDATGLWTNEAAGATLFSSIDEAAISDADFIQSADTPSQDISRVKMDPPPWGNVATGQPVTVRYRYRSTGVDATAVAVRLKEGTTLIAEWVHTSLLTSYVTGVQVLTTGQKAAITNWNNLFLEFEANPSLFTPADLFAASELGGWYDISDITSMWQEDTQTTPAAVGSRVGYVTDKSGNGRHLIQATDSIRPFLRQDGSGNYYLELDGTYALRSTVTLTTLTEGALVLGGQSDAGCRCSFSWSVGSTPSSSDRFLIHPSYDDVRYFDAFNATAGQGRISESTGADRALEVVVANAESDGTREYHRNGLLEMSGTATDLSGVNMGWINLIGEGAIYKVYGAIVVDRALTPTEITNVEQWMAEKTGVTL